MAETDYFERVAKGGIVIHQKLIVPLLAADPSGGDLVEGLVWFNSVDEVLRYYNGTDVQDLTEAGTGLSPTDFNANTILAADTDDTPAPVTISEQQVVGRLTGGNIKGLSVAELRTLIGVTKAYIDTLDIDAETLGGQTAAQLQTTITSAIIDSAPGTLDTLNELAAALGDDPNFATTIIASIATKARTYEETLDGGAATEVVTHNLNTRDLIARVYVNSGNYEEEGYIIQRTSVNTLTVVSEAGNIPAGRRIVVMAKGA